MAARLAPVGMASELARMSGKIAVAVAGVEVAGLDALLPGVAFEAADVDLMGTAPWATAEPAAVVVVARTSTDLRRAVTVSGSFPATTMVGVVVLETPQWCDAPGVPLSPGLGRRFLRDVSVSRYDKSGWRVKVRFSQPRPAGEVVAAVARSFGGHHLSGYALPMAGLAGPGLAVWRPGDPNVTFADERGPAPDRSDVPTADLAVRAVPVPPGEGWADPRVPAADRPAEVTWERLGSPGGYGELRASALEPGSVPPVDERSVNPRGFLKTPSEPVADLTQHDGRWEVRAEDRTLVRLAASGGVTDADIGRLRRLRGLRVAWSPAHTGPVAAVHAVAGLAAAGIPLLSDPPPAWAASALGPELSARVSAATEHELADELRREEHSVLLRRLALAGHGTMARWRSLAALAGVATPAEPSLSVVLCTRRADLVPFALGQIARQRGVDLEVLLTLHGVSAAVPEVAGAVAAFGRPITIVEADSRLPFGSVLNQAAAQATGSYLSKWDDDDWYGPDHLADMMLAQAYSGAELVGAASEFFYLQQIDVTIRRDWTSETMSDHVAGGTFVVSRSAFEALGGFRPVARSVDVQFFQDLLRAGGAIYRTHGLGFVARRAARGVHTWQEPVGYFLARAKEQWRGFRPSRLMEWEQ
ncbi:glycosyltransferase family A protein [Sphaerisporangium corydalis]|uniref:Glycosyltransferase n=1 Tax=Sphaerisporangium corydalis TaxID=1441875 RepID=A0ABV9EQA2_9ACTN|nr:glycosyltransferase family A protein [Sphaerisporangium corydalis]